MLSLYYYGFGRRGLAFLLIVFLLGLGLALNCIRGLHSREGMYDEGNTSYMTLMQWLGIVLGLGLATWSGVGL
jgi:hypothetical protein